MKNENYNLKKNQNMDLSSDVKNTNYIFNIVRFNSCAISVFAEVDNVLSEDENTKDEKMFKICQYLDKNKITGINIWKFYENVGRDINAFINRCI